MSAAGSEPAEVRAGDLAMLATAAAHAQRSALLPTYARDAMGASARIVVGLVHQVAELSAQVAELKRQARERGE